MSAVALTPGQISELTPSLFAYAYRVVRRADEAEDLVQDTWISAMRTLPKFEGRSSLRTWLVSILRRRIADRYRRVKPTEALEEARREVAHVPDPVAEMDQSSASSAVLGALDSLTDLERRAVVACDVQDMDREDAAESLGVTRGHLRVLLHRGRQKLRDQLTEQGWDEVLR